MSKGIILVFIAVIINTFGQLCIKYVMNNLGPIAFSSPNEIIDAGWQILRQPLIWFVLPLYGANFIVWAVALSRLPLSLAYPLLAVGFIVTPLAAMFFFNEDTSFVRWVGIGITIIGIVLVGRS